MGFVLVIVLHSPALCLDSFIIKYWGWKRLLWSSNQAINLTLNNLTPKPCPWCAISTHLLNAFRNGAPPLPWAAHVNDPFSEERFPNIPIWVQLEALFSCSISCYLGEVTYHHLTTTSLVVESDKGPPEPPLIQAKQWSGTRWKNVRVYHYGLKYSFRGQEDDVSASSMFTLNGHTKLQIAPL